MLNVWSFVRRCRERGLLIVFFFCIVYWILCLWWILFQSSHDIESTRPSNKYGLKPKLSKDGPKQFRIVLCAKVTAENPYLLEWIEFHRIQGVDKFVLYHDTVPMENQPSSIELSWLPILYREVEERRRRFGQFSWNNSTEDIIEVLPASLLVPDLWPGLATMLHNTGISHRILQPVLVSHCAEKYKSRSDYILHLDIDEFIYAPLYPSVWDFLMYEKKQQSWKKYILGRMASAYISSINYGSSGQFWDFHTYWRPDADSGMMHTYFDPRDSSLFRFLVDPMNRHIFKKYNLEQLNSYIKKELIEYRLKRLYDTNFRTTNLTTFYNYVNAKLQKDFTFIQPIQLSIQSLNEDNVESYLSLPTLSKLPLARRSNANNDYPILQTSITDVSDLRLLATRLRKSVYNSSRETTTLNHNVFPILHAIKTEHDRLKAYNRSITLYNSFYPLLIEEQLLRAPSRSSGLDKYESETNSALFTRVMPACLQPKGFKREQYLIENEGYINNTQSFSNFANFLRHACDGNIPATITQAGKSLYVSDSMHRSDLSRKHGILRGCFRPNVHGCSHWIFGGYTKYLDARKELRIDHHQFRSFERRTFQLPKWRGGPLGYSTKFNYTAMQYFFHLIYDDSKLRFVPELRKRLLDFEPVPKITTYKLTDNIHTSIIDNSLDCTPLELLGEHQVMCPKDFPYVGLQLPVIPPPHPYYPYQWCSKVPINSLNEILHSTLNLLKNSFNASSKDIEDSFRNKTILCPGYGEIRCCNYNEEFVSFQTEVFQSLVHAWKASIPQWTDALFA